jgi:hypothetical protein
MARFAQDCARKAKEVTRKLEVELGPETSTLGFRFGLHSGPVTGNELNRNIGVARFSSLLLTRNHPNKLFSTGGVLRGQNARFQM